MQKWLSKQDEIIVVGKWNGEETSETLDWLTEHGYAWRIQRDDIEEPEDLYPGQENDPVPSGEVIEIGVRERLAILGPRIWEHTQVDKGDLIILRENGHMQSIHPQGLAKGYYPKPE